MLLSARPLGRRRVDPDRLHAAFRKRRTRRLGRGGRGGGRHPDRSARRSGRASSPRSDAAACCSARRCTASSWPTRCACRGSRCARSRRCTARSGTTGPTRWTFGSRFHRLAGFVAAGAAAGLAARRAASGPPSAGPVAGPSAARRLTRRRFVDQAAQSLAAAAAAPPQLSAAAALDRCRTRMLERLDALRREPATAPCRLASPCGTSAYHGLIAARGGLRRPRCHGASAAHVPTIPIRRTTICWSASRSAPASCWMSAATPAPWARPIDGSIRAHGCSASKGPRQPRRWRRGGSTRSRWWTSSRTRCRSTLDRPIDCIVYGDVLEHLRDPWRGARAARSRR